MPIRRERHRARELGMSSASEASLRGTDALLGQCPAATFRTACSIRTLGYQDAEQIVRPSLTFMISCSILAAHQDEALARSHQPPPRGKVVSRTTGMWPRRTRQTSRAPALPMRRVFPWPEL